MRRIRAAARAALRCARNRSPMPSTAGPAGDAHLKRGVMRRGARCGCWRGKEGGGLRSRWGRIRAGQVAGRVVQVPWLAVGEGCHEQAATTGPEPRSAGRHGRSAAVRGASSRSIPPRRPTLAGPYRSVSASSEAAVDAGSRSRPTLTIEILGCCTSMPVATWCCRPSQALATRSAGTGSAEPWGAAPAAGGREPPPGRFPLGPGQAAGGSQPCPGMAADHGEGAAGALDGSGLPCVARWRHPHPGARRGD